MFVPGQVSNNNISRHFWQWQQVEELLVQTRSTAIKLKTFLWMETPLKTKWCNRHKMLPFYLFSMSRWGKPFLMLLIIHTLLLISTGLLSWNERLTFDLLKMTHLFCIITSFTEHVRPYQPYDGRPLLETGLAVLLLPRFDLQIKFGMSQNKVTV